jgi:hypothetical protein
LTRHTNFPHTGGFCLSPLHSCLVDLEPSSAAMSAKLPSPSVISSQPYPFWLGGEYSPFCFGVVLTSASLAVHSNHSAQGWPQPLQPLLPSTFRRSVMSWRTSSILNIRSLRSPLDLTKVRLQASGDKRMIQSIKKTIKTAGASLYCQLMPLSVRPLHCSATLIFWMSGVRGLFDGISGTWLRQMSYSMCRFWAYDESKKLVGAGA